MLIIKDTCRSTNEIFYLWYVTTPYNGDSIYFWIIVEVIVVRVYLMGHNQHAVTAVSIFAVAAF